MNETTMLRLGGVLGALAVVAGAFGAHALTGRLEPKDLATFEVAVRYQAYHAIGLVLCSVLAPRREVGRAAQGFLWGTVVFSGSLYVLVLTGQRWLGAVTPVGGVLWILAWLALAFARPRASA